MSKQFDFYYDFGSPTTYLAYVQIEGLVARTGATAVLIPALLGGIFKSTNNRSPVTVPAKGAWMAKDMQRFAKRYGVPFAMNSHFPINTLMLMRGAIVAQRDGFFKQYNDAMFNAMWAEGKNMGDPMVIGSVLAKAGIDPQKMITAVQEQSVKDTLRANTDQAVARGAFGMPAFFVDDELYWGQDRLDFVEEALSTP